MDHKFSCKEKGNWYLSLPRSHTDDTNTAGLMENSCWDVEDSFSDSSEMTKFDAYSEWCNNLGDQIFPSFMSTSFSPFDVFNFIEQSYSEIPFVEDDIVGNASSVCRDNVMFQQCSQLGFPANSVANGVDLVKRIDNSFVDGEVENSCVPRTLAISLSEKMHRALYLFKEMSGGGILAQVWVPMKNGDQHVLSTFEQPCSLDGTLSGYREVSTSFTFDVESKPGSFPGLPGRVFTSKVPEWTSNVRYYNKAEYLRVHHALHHEIRGSIALPLFEDDSPTRCCAVLEIVTLKEKSDFNSEMDNVCRALQAVKLRSSAPPTLSPETLSKYQRAAISEITNMLRAICHAHRLPVALTWIPCSYLKGSNDETIKVRNGRCNLTRNEKSVLCIESSACYVNDKNMHGFVHACEEHYLEEGQGIVGKSLQSNHPFFYPDVKEYHISEYPLVQHARKFGLNAAVAVRLRSTYTGDNDYILELFLPVDMKGSAEQQLLLNNLSSTMQRMCQSLRTVSDAELIGTEYSNFELQDGVVNPIVLSSTSEVMRSSGNLDFCDHVTQNVSESVSGEMEVDGLHEKAWAASTKQMEKKRSTTEKHVSLSVLQQYFSGSLKDAAKSIGVCPTTLKRICRQHGISRWPSRKINKVNRSLRKIQSVLDSVQGMEGGLTFDPTVRGLLTPGSIIQDLASKRTFVSPSTNLSPRNTDRIDVGSTVVKTENEFFVDGTRMAGLEFSTPGFSNAGCKSKALDSMTKPEASEPQLVCRSSSPMVPIDEIDTSTKNGAWMDGDDGVVENNHPASSIMTDSSNGSGSGSGTKGSSCSSQSSAERSDPKAESGSKITFKATYNEDMIRFKLEPGSGCIQLYEEVAKRFKLYMGHFQLKYLDDEDEWVLLVSDSDLNECLEVLDYVGTRSVKLLVRDMPFSMGSSGGSSSNYFMGGESL